MIFLHLSSFSDSNSFMTADSRVSIQCCMAFDAEKVLKWINENQQRLIAFKDF